MNDDQKEKLRNISFFRKKDIFVYSVIVVLITILFFAVFFSKKDKSVKGFIVSIGEDTVITFEYQTQKYTVAGEYKENVVIDTTLQTITVFFNEQKTDYNVISYDLENGSVKITESTCSQRKDCTTFKAISDSGFIYCAPHDLKITPMEGEGFISPTVG